MASKGQLPRPEGLSESWWDFAVLLEFFEPTEAMGRMGCGKTCLIRGCHWHSTSSPYDLRYLAFVTFCNRLCLPHFHKSIQRGFQMLPVCLPLDMSLRSKRSLSRMAEGLIVSASIDVAVDQAMQLRIECVLLSGDVAAQPAMQ